MRPEPYTALVKLEISHYYKVKADNRPQYIPDAVQLQCGLKGFDGKCSESTLPKNYHWAVGSLIW
jgi:hypothetical protein